MEEVRTNIHIISDLLKYVVDAEWSGTRPAPGCHCHPEYRACCPECKNFEHVFLNYKIDQSHDRNHKEDCKLYSLIKEVRAVIEVENEIRCKNGEEYIDCY